MKKAKVIEKIKKVLTQVEPYITGHGGYIEFVDFEEDTGRVLVNLQGACQHCALSSITLKFGLEEALKKELSEVKEVVPV